MTKKNHQRKTQNLHQRAKNMSSFIGETPAGQDP